MNWPPNKAWTSADIVHGYRHFVAINYGGEGTERWVLLVSVLDGRSNFTVEWKNMCDPSQWTSGWLELPKGKADRPIQKQIEDDDKKFLDQNSCLHASDDSGLIIPLINSEIRPWF